MRDPYEVLGLERGAGAEDVKRSYRRLVREYHPDLNTNPVAELRFKEVTAAYGVLGDPHQRALYDEFGAEALEQGFDPGMARAWRSTEGRTGPTSSPFGDLSAFHDVLSSAFESEPPPPPPPPRGRPVPPESHGRGAESHGRGAWSDPPPRREAQRHVAAIDPMLSFTGGSATITVNRPDGRAESLRVRVPAGAKTGDVVTVNGFSGRGGDLQVELEIPDHPLLRRTGDDLEMDLPVTLLEAVQGGAITVPTPTGMARVQLPPRCAGQKLRLRGRGVQRPDRPGNLVLVLRLTLPDDMDAMVIEACRAIERAYHGDLRDRLRL